MATHNGNTQTGDSRSTEVPVEVQVDTKDGVDPQALVLAKAFMEKVGGLARITRRRGDLSHLYICTMASWASTEVMEDVSQQRHFKQVLFALAHGLHLVRVVGDGRTLLWNRYRDNSGNEIEDTRPRRDDRGHSQREDRGGQSRREDRGGQSRSMNNGQRNGRYQTGGDGDRRKERRASE